MTNLLLGVALLLAVTNLLLSAFLNWQTKELLEYICGDMTEIITTCLKIQELQREQESDEVSPKSPEDTE